jgi:MFS family permease
MSPGSHGVPHKTWTVVLASLGVFMTALDTLVVTTSLPALRVDLHASLPSLEWTVNAYNLAFACALLTGAALGDRVGRRRRCRRAPGCWSQRAPCRVPGPQS